MEKHFQLSSAFADAVHYNERSRFIGLGQFSTLSTWVIPNVTQRFFSPQACVKQLRCFLRQIVASMPHQFDRVAQCNPLAVSKHSVINKNIVIDKNIVINTKTVINRNNLAWEFKNDR